MKRLISWLLALTLIVGLLPMSVFAVEVETEGDDDFTVDMWELQVGGSEANPLDLTTDLLNEGDFSATVTIPAGMTGYYIAYRVGGMYMTINDGEAVECVTAGMMYPYSWSIKNETEAEATYTIKVAFPEGHQSNPKIIESMYYSDEVTQELGDTDGFFYKYIAPADGTVTVYIVAEYDEETWELIDYGTQRDIMVTNNTTNAQYSLVQNGVDNNGLELQVPVSEGDELIINTAWVQDADGNYYPAGTYSWAGNFTYPVGTEQNPATIEWTWNDAQTVATATVTVEADGTYYAGISGMILTVDGVETEMSETAAFMLNAGTYELILSTPEGTYNNPAQLVIGENTATVAAGSWGGYMYTWTAEEDGTLSLTMPSDQDWFYVINNTTAGTYGDGQWSDSDPVVNPGTIEVAAGDVLSIEVNTYNSEDPYNNPGGTVTFTASFEVAEVAPEYNVVASGIALDMASELFIQAKFLIPAELQADTNATVTLEFKGDVTEYNLAELIAEKGLDSKGRLVLIQPIPSPYMDKKITITIKDGNGYAADFTSGSNSYEGSFSYGIEEYADVAFAQSDDYKTTKDAIVALLTYGSYAQVYFSDLPNVSSEPVSNLLAKYGREPIDISAFSLDMIDQVGTDAGAEMGISIRGGTPALDAAVYMEVQFNATGLNIDEYDFVLKYYEAASGKNYTVDLEEVDEEGNSNVRWDSRGRFIVKIENISAALFDCMYSVEITNTTTGEVYTGSYSIFCYLKTIINGYQNDTSKVDDLNLYKSMYYYNQAANALFE